MYKNLSKIISGYKEKYASLDFDLSVEDLSFKISVTKNDCLVSGKNLFGFEINIFNETIDYSLINYDGDTTEHQYYDNFDYNNLIKLFDEKIDLLTNDIVSN